MSKLKDSKSKVLGYISAIRTMLDNYPQPKMSDELMTLLNSNTPFGFLMNMLAICGVDTTKLLNWVSKILSGKEVLMSGINKASQKANEKISGALGGKVSQGFLDSLEEVIRVLLLTNVKNMFTCSFNPFIPDEVLKSYSLNNINGDGIKIPLTTIDLFNVLSHTPSDGKGYGKVLYFDNDYGSNEMWKSTDFNAFLWYVIHKGTNTDTEKLKLIWDNRVRKRKILNNNETLKNNFFNTINGDGSFVGEKDVYGDNNIYPNRPDNKKTQKKDTSKIQKKQYIIVEYNERDSTTISAPDCLTVWLNGDRYQRKNESGDFWINKTVFEFNFDFIYSLKLFDSKVIVANVINSLLGIGNAAAGAMLDGKYSLEQEIIAGKVSQVVRELINAGDTVINDCFFSFSNDEYETLMKDAEMKQYNQYQFGEAYGTLTQEEAQTIINSIDSIGQAGTLEEVQTNIANIFNNVASTIPAESESGEISDKFTLSSNILFTIIEQCVVQIVMQVLSPKVILLFALNSYFMGDVTDNDFSKISIQNFIKGLSNLISTIVKQVFDLIMQELILFLLNEIRDLIVLMVEKLLLERVRFYIELLKRLLALLLMFFKGFNSSPDPQSIIDDVRYVDIIPQQTEPPSNKC